MPNTTNDHGRIQSITGAELPNTVEKEGKSALNIAKPRADMHGLDWRPMAERTAFTVLAPVTEDLFIPMPQTTPTVTSPS